MAVIMTVSEKELKKKKPKVVKNPNLDKILEIVKSKKFKAIELTPKGRYNQLSAGLEIGWDPKDKNEWFLSLLFVPDTKKHNHEHLDIDVKSMKKLHNLIGSILEEVEKLPKKKKK